MRALLLNDTQAFAGIERHILALASALPSEHVHATIACPHDSQLAKRAVAAHMIDRRRGVTMKASIAEVAYSVPNDAARRA